MRSFSRELDDTLDGARLETATTYRIARAAAQEQRGAHQDALRSEDSDHQELHRMPSAGIVDTSDPPANSSLLKMPRRCFFYGSTPSFVGVAHCIAIDVVAMGCTRTFVLV